MGLRARILRIATETGPRPRRWWSYCAQGKDNFDTTFERMLQRGELVKFGDRKGATYGVPKSRRAA